MEKLILHIHENDPSFQKILTLIPAIQQKRIEVLVRTGLVLYLEGASGSEVYEGEVVLPILRTRARSTDRVTVHMHEGTGSIQEVLGTIAIIEQRGVFVSRCVGLFLYTKGKYKANIHQGDSVLRVLRECAK